MARWILVVTAMAALAATAVAQDVRPPAPARDYLAQHPQLQNSCETVDGLSLCIEPSGPSRAHGQDKQEPGKLTRFTRLAGMFMGRVDAADLGPFKFRFKLEIR